MKILIVRLWPDELNIKSYNCQEIGLAKALIRKGNTCDIVLYTKGESYEEDFIFDNSQKIHIYHLCATTFLKNGLYGSALYKIAEKYDIIQSSEYDQLENISLYKKFKDKLVIYHGPYDSEYTKGYKKKCFISDVCCLVNQGYKKTKFIAKSELACDFLNKKGFHNCITLGVGIDTDRFEEQQDINDKLIQLENEKREKGLKYLLYIGKIEERRNVLFLIEILDQLLKTDDSFRLVLIGKGDSPYVEKCINFAKSINIDDKIIWIENLSQGELPSLYKCCDAFLLPTKYEIFGMVILESMYFGLPVITTLNGGSSTIIKNNETGIICLLNDKNEWVSAVNKLFQDNNLRDTISKNSSKLVSSNFTWDALADKFIRIYKSEKG